MTAVLSVAVFVFLTGPGRLKPVEPSAVPTSIQTIRGAFHLHTTRSDGALDKDGVAAAAARAGLQFVVLTDHGNALRGPDPPTYLHGVLVVDGVEISTNGGHYIALGMPASPYPLGGDAAAVVEDVARLGGFGVAAHPVSARAELSWMDWDARIDAMEWLNADSEWRDERRLTLARAFLDYFWRPAGALGALLDRPVGALHRWDQLTSTRKVVALAGHDAHGGLGSESGTERGRKLHIPSYEASFRTFSTHVVLGRPLTGNAGIDADALLAAFRSGAVYSVVDAIAGPGSLDFHASKGGVRVGMGETLQSGRDATAFGVRASVPSGATTILKRNGLTVAHRSGGALDHTDPANGAYRVEIEVAGAPGTPPVPWLVSNPIYVVDDPAEVLPIPSSVSEVGFALNSAWRVESDPGSNGIVSESDGAVALAYRLKGPPVSSQFVALVTDLRDVTAQTSSVMLRGRSSRPMRVSVQLRYGRDENERWGRSVYLDTDDRSIRLSLDSLRYLGETRAGATAGVPSRPSIDRATSLLFVVDLTNATPGTEGMFSVKEVGFGR